MQSKYFFLSRLFSWPNVTLVVAISKNKNMDVFIECVNGLTRTNYRKQVDRRNQSITELGKITLYRFHKSSHRILINKYFNYKSHHL